MFSGVAASRRVTHVGQAAAVDQSVTTPNAERQAVRSLPPWFGPVAFLCASAFYVTAILLSPPLVGLYHDDGIYIGSALSLARGDGYRIPHLPGSPLQAKYPPLYPLVLLPIAWIIGDNPTAIGLYRWPSVFATLGALA